MKQPQGFVDSRFPDHVCLLKKAIYGLRQAPRAWYLELRSYLLSCGFTNAHSDNSLFIYHCGDSLLFFLVYVDDIIVTERHNMLDAKGVSTLLSTSSVLSLNDGSAPTDAKEYGKDIGALKYLWLTRLDTCFAVNKLAQFMHSSAVKHWQAVKRLLQNLKHTITYGVHFKKSSFLSLTAFSDDDWADNHDDGMSTSAHLIFVGSNPVSWSSKKQRTIAR
ncbi:PREDICTED: uncharacterized protein LOC109238990 [Nicotiana attenuata]|uniref:uncharacterized protein LOC109238990 n=1 Tax=Nicotiana attenuata TaxID=49451 RepID=UPI0009054534|nr:PREDICTED: uncharacterized protein LOC109238990 [Nicotiana attenuata]